MNNNNVALSSWHGHSEQDPFFSIDFLIIILCISVVEDIEFQ